MLPLPPRDSSRGHHTERRHRGRPERSRLVSVEKRSARHRLLDDCAGRRVAVADRWRRPEARGIGGPIVKRCRLRSCRRECSTLAACPRPISSSTQSTKAGHLATSAPTRLRVFCQLATREAFDTNPTGVLSYLLKLQRPRLA